MIMIIPTIMGIFILDTNIERLDGGIMVDIELWCAAAKTVKEARDVMCTSESSNLISSPNYSAVILEFTHPPCFLVAHPQNIV
jgi:hypothetical protein